MEDIWEQLTAYLSAYLPGWHNQTGNPDVESALMTVMGEVLAHSRSQLDLLPDKHLTEFLSAWPDTPVTATSTHVYGALHTPHSTFIPQGSQFYRNGDGTKVWETTHDTWAEPGQLIDQVFACGSNGKLYTSPPPSPDAPIRLFDFQTPGIQRRELRLCHDFAFSSRSGCHVCLELDGSTVELLRNLCDPHCVNWYLDCGLDWLALPTPDLQKTTLRFQLPSAPHSRALVIQVLDGILPPAHPVERLMIHTYRSPCPPTHVVSDGGTYQSDAPWLPFGTKFQAWNTCYLSCPDVLGLPGAHVTLTWLQSFVLEEERLFHPQPAQGYKPIMRRMPQPPPPSRDVGADVVLWEYWDGSTWQIIPGTQPYTQLFSPAATTQPQPMEATFFWPEDAAPSWVHGIYGYWLRWRIHTCQGAGWVPACYHAPQLAQLQFSAHLSPQPVRIERRYDLEQAFAPVSPSNRLVLFPPIPSQKDEWWMGFDLPPQGDSVTVYFTLQGLGSSGAISVWESTPHHPYHPLSIQDQTNGLSHSGAMTWSGFLGKKTIRFGLERWWVCVREESGCFHGCNSLPTLIQLDLGVALLRAVAQEPCAKGDLFSPLHGGSVRGVARTDGFGGTTEPSHYHPLSRLQQQRHHRNRAVSAWDAHELIAGYIPSVVNIRCIREGDVLYIGVLLRDADHHAAFHLQRPNLERLLWAYSPLPSLGLSFRVREPSFYPVHVTVWIHLPTHTSLDQIRRSLTRALNQFLAPATGNFHGMGWQMGILPTMAQLRTFLLSTCSELQLVELVASATTPQGGERDLHTILDPFALPVAGIHSIFQLEGGSHL